MRRVAAGQVAAVRDACVAEANALRAAGECAAAANQLMEAIGHGHLPSRADFADMLIEGREGVAVNHRRAFVVVEDGARLGCHHCQGMMSRCYLGGYGCGKDADRSVALARTSAARGSKYGQYTLGMLYQYGEGGVAQDYPQAIVQYRLAAAQNHDEAQNNLGLMFGMGNGIAQNKAAALHWHQMAAAQGHRVAASNVAWYYECGTSVAADKAEAIRWYKRAAAAGYSAAANHLKRLGE